MRARFWSTIGCFVLYSIFLGTIVSVLLWNKGFGLLVGFKWVFYLCALGGIVGHGLCVEPTQEPLIVAASVVAGGAAVALATTVTSELGSGLSTLAFLAGAWTISEKTRGFPLYLLLAVVLIWTLAGEPLAGLQLVLVLWLTKAVHDWSQPTQ